MRKQDEPNRRRVNEMLRTWARVLKSHVPFARHHRRLFLLGSLAALLVVAIRLAIPQVFYAMLQPWLVQAGPGVLATDPSYWRTVAVFGGLVCAMFIGLGLADHWERIQFARFAIAMVRDLRQAAGRALLKSRRGDGSGDLVVRLVGDTARMKAGIKGFLVHVATNGVLCFGATVILLTVNLYLGLVLALSVLAIMAVTCFGAAVVFDLALKNRGREGKLGLSIERHQAGQGKIKEFEKHNERSGGYEAAVTRAQGRITWAAHAIYGLAIVAALIAGATRIGSGNLAVSGLALFLLYALMLRAPVVQLARQGSRTGKILACAVRIDEMITSTQSGITGPRLFPLVNAMKLKGIRVKAAKTSQRRTRLRKVSITLAAGSRTLILGQRAGKTTLLQVLAGDQLPMLGKIMWDGTPLPKSGRSALAQHVHYCPGPFAHWNRQRLGDWLGVGHRSPAEEVVQVLKFCGAWSIVHKLRAGLATKIASSQLSTGERAALALAKAVLSPHSVLLLDEPLPHASTRKKERILTRILAHRPGRTIVYAARKASAPGQFHQVFRLEKGKLKAEGPAAKAKPDRFGQNGVSQAQSAEPAGDRPAPVTSTPRQLRVLFTGYAPVHFVCFRPLYEQLLAGGVEVFVSGGLRSTTDTEKTHYDERGLYDPFGLSAGQVLPVEEIQQRDFDILFAANTKMICPRSVKKRIQLFHGISFRNRAVRDHQRGTDYYFLIGPYMHRRFLERGLLQEGDGCGLKVGFPKTDRLLNGKLDRRQILQPYGFTGSRPVLLYAPTGEEHNSLETMGEDIIRRLAAGAQFDLLVKLHDHPKNKTIDWPVRLRSLENEHVRVAREADIIPLMYAADMLISDASSVSSEYSLLNRPMVFLDVPELVALARSRSHSAVDLDTWGQRAGPIVKSPEAIVKEVECELAHPERHEEIRRHMAEDLFYNPGCSTNMAVEWVQKAFS